MPAVGIDLGTSNSAIAVYQRGRPQVIPIDGRSVMPSCVGVRPDGELIVGEQAKSRAALDPERTVQAIKREMGNREHTVRLNNRDYSPVDISGLILKKLVAAAQQHLGEPVRDAVISVPAYFTNNQKEDTRFAGEQAGLNVLRLVPEPTAAAIAYGLNKGRDQTILVFDLGGGTFDVSILKVIGNNFEVVGIGGDHDLGGEDFDRRFVDLIVGRLREQGTTSSDLLISDPEMLRQTLKEVAENAKKELSSAESADVVIPNLLASGSCTLKVTRSQYESATKDLVARTIEVTMKTLRDARLDAEDIDRVVLVGGSTRIPVIQRALSEKIIEPYIADNVDQVVAEGASILAANITSSVEMSRENYAPIEVTNVTPHSLGIRADADRFVEIIPQGSQLPTQASKDFTLASERADRTDVVVFQGQEENCSDNEQIGGFALTGISSRGQKPRITVNFSLDADDILTVDAVDQLSGRSGSVQIEKYEAGPYEPESVSTKDISNLKFACSAVGCDDAGAVIKQMGFRVKPLKHKDFRKIKVLSQYDLVFINCLADITQVVGPGINLSPKKNAAALRTYVENGGILYVSDYALNNIEHAFPNYIVFGGKGDGPSGKITAEVVDEGLRGAIGKTCPINFNTIYAPVRSVNADCKIYLQKGREPILVSFPYGAGHVVYTSFHNGAQVSDKENELLMFIILQTISLATNSPLVELADSVNIKRK